MKEGCVARIARMERTFKDSSSSRHSSSVTATDSAQVVRSVQATVEVLCCGLDGDSP